MTVHKMNFGIVFTFVLYYFLCFIIPCMSHFVLFIRVGVFLDEPESLENQKLPKDSIFCICVLGYIIKLGVPILTMVGDHVYL